MLGRISLISRVRPYLRAGYRGQQQHEATLSAVRQFWNFGGKKDDDNNNNNNSGDGNDKVKDAEVVSVEKEEVSKGIVSPFGDHSPAISPLLILPTAKKPLFPGYITNLLLKNEPTIEALLDVNGTLPKYVGLFFRKNESLFSGDAHNTGELISNADEIYRVGTFASIQNVVKTDMGTQVLLMGHRRINIDHISSFGPPAIADVTHWKKPNPLISKKPHIRAYTNEVLASARELIKQSPLLQEQLQVAQLISKVDFHDPFKLTDFATFLLSADGHELQKVLETEDIEQRLSLILDLLAKEKELVRIEKEIRKQVEDKVSKQQREYFLREQLKSIKQELGMEKDDKEGLLSKYQEQLKQVETRNVHKDTLKLIRDEVKKLESLEKNSPEFNVTRSYLDWLFCIPWGLMSQDVLNLKKAKGILDEDHYGLDEIKKRILEFIAVGKLKGSVSGKIICFIGPPGVGKTSIAKSIARALDKKFYRFSVGGLTDTAEIKGHRRTYIGAMPGKPVQCLKSTGFLNPLILIDEIDKLGKSYNGDPASALLELLDPNQNSNFVDHYLDTPIDFSNVLFVCTANDESSIPGPLKDRMEVIRLSGYDIPEKVAIASKYLVPKALKDAGLVKDEHDAAAIEHYKISDETLQLLIKNYCRESGVRSLEKSIEKIARKIAFEQVGDDETDGELQQRDHKEVSIQAKDLEKYVGKPIFAEETIYESGDAPLPPGIVMGLAWNPLGGSPIFIETVAIPTAYSERDSGIHMVTGQLGSVMKESASIAYTYAKKFVSEKDLANKFFNSNQVHLHVPEGAISKDGPSAGVAMTTSFISVAMNKSLNPKIAMTGELSLTGKVLPVGGIKEKTLAAKRAGAKTIILPAANKRDFDELPEYVKEDVTVHFVKEYREVYEIVFA